MSSTVIPALFALVAAVAVPVTAIVVSDDGSAVPRAAAEPAYADVTLGEMFVKPSVVEVPAGEIVLRVRNGGVAVHTLAVKDHGAPTRELKGGESAELAVGRLAAGTYGLLCTIPGHAEAGMMAELVVTGPAGGHQANGHTEAIDFRTMDAKMAAPVKAFPAKTQGKGAQPLAPKVLADGTKEFALTTSEVKWEVEPGKFVDAMAYNGTVPGPTIKVDVGDKVRVVLRNEMKVSTSIHFHGISTPNAMDGVPDITQPPVTPGSTFVYAFTATRPSVGMYHSHHDAVKQVPDGLAGTFLIGDMPRPAGVTVARTLPMVLNDAGTIGLSLNGKSFPATEPIAVKPGEWTEIHYLNEGAQIHPMHLHGLDQLVTAKDGFAVPEPYYADTVTVAPGERYTVLVKASAPGVWAWHCHILSHAESENGMFGMVTAMVVK